MSETRIAFSIFGIAVSTFFLISAGVRQYFTWIFWLGLLFIFLYLFYLELKYEDIDG